MECPKCDTPMESMGYGDEKCPNSGHSEYAESEEDFNERIYGNEDDEDELHLSNGHTFNSDDLTLDDILTAGDL